MRQAEHPLLIGKETKASESKQLALLNRVHKENNHYKCFENKRFSVEIRSFMNVGDAI